MRDFTRLSKDVGSTLVGYIAGQLKISAILACLYAIGFAICEVPGWPLVALVSGFLNLIPIVGSLIGVALALLLTWADDGGVYRLAGVLAVWVVVQGLEGFWLTPRILGSKLRLSPLVVFLAVIFGAMLFGPIGVLLAAPVLAVLVVFWRYFGDINRRSGRPSGSPASPDDQDSSAPGRSG